jgi:hypothetical protein
VHREHDAISGVAFHLGDAPGVFGACHEIISDGDSVLELGAEEKVTCVPGVVIKYPSSTKTLLHQR